MNDIYDIKMTKTIALRIKDKESKTLAEHAKDEVPVKRIKQGIKDAKAGRGRFVSVTSHRKEVYR